MAHVRKQLRDMIAADVALVGDLDGRVYTNRDYPVPAVPAAVVYNIVDEVEEDLGDAQVRRISIGVDLLDKAAADLRDALEGLAEEAIAIIEADAQLVASVLALDVDSIELEAEDGADAPTGAARIALTCTVQVSPDDPETFIS